LEDGTRQTLTRYWPITTVIVAAVIVFAVVYVLRSIVFPFLIGLAFAYALHPAVDWIEKRVLPRRMRTAGGRVSAIAIVYILVVVVSAAFFYFTISAIMHSLAVMSANSTDYFSAAADALKRYTQSVRQLVPEGLRVQMDNLVATGTDTLLAAARTSIENMVASLQSNVGVLLSLAAIPLFLFYVLKDHEKLMDGLYSGLPNWASSHARAILTIFERNFGRYVRSTLTLGLMVGLGNLAGLLIIRAPMAPLLAVVAGVAEMIPMVGGWLGAIIAVIVMLALAPEKAIWVAAIFAVVQLTENLFLVPRVQSAFFKIHPSITIVLIVVGAYVAGVWGVVLVMPLTATVLGVLKYSREITRPPTEPETCEVPAPTD
jgi:predicted PurR-regulated permease PerM